MKKWNEFMNKVMADEALQKEFAEIIGDSGEKLTKEQKEKIAELAGKLRIELDVDGELSGSIAGGRDVGGSILWRSYPLPSPPTMVWEMETYRCKNCGKTKTVSYWELGCLRSEDDCPVGFPGLHKYERIE